MVYTNTLNVSLILEGKVVRAHDIKINTCLTNVSSFAQLFVLCQDAVMILFISRSRSITSPSVVILNGGREV